MLLRVPQMIAMPRVQYTQPLTGGDDQSQRASPAVHPLAVCITWFVDFFSASAALIGRGGIRRGKAAVLIIMQRDPLVD